MTLWPHQAASLPKLREAFQAARSVCYVLPTGGGKTRLAAYVAAAYVAAGRRVLWLAHTRELVAQARATVPDAVTVTTYQALLGGARPPADMVVLDEAHHLGAEQWSAIPRDYLAAGARLLGLTATPERGDGRPLGDLFQRLVVGAYHSELLRIGAIVPADVFAPPQRQRGLAMPVGEALETYARGEQAIVFAASVPEAVTLAASLPAAAVVHGDTPEDERDRTMDGFRSGEIRTLVNVRVLTEGVDVPQCGCVVIACPVGTVGGWLQMTGRALRAAPGKTRAVVADLLGNVHTGLGPPDGDREYRLDGDVGVSRSGPDAPALWRCPRCFYVTPAPPGDRRCPLCHALMPEPEALRLQRRHMELVAREAGYGADEWARERERLRQVAAAKGYKPAWVEFMMRAKIERAAKARGAA